jgi:hypothetical protein
VTCVARERSTTPLQALATLNNEVFVEAAQGLARRIVIEPEASNKSRIQFAWKVCTSRSPTSHEVEIFAELWSTYRDHYWQHPDNAISVSGGNLPDRTPVADFAAWVATARMLLNLDEFTTRG